jgi:hypothetical protein
MEEKPFYSSLSPNIDMGLKNGRVWAYELSIKQQLYTPYTNAKHVLYGSAIF